MKDDDYTTKNDPCQLFISKSHREPVRLWFLQHTRPRCLPSQGAHFTRFEKKLHILNDFRVTPHCPRLHFRDQTPVTFATSHGIQGMTAHVNCLDIKRECLSSQHSPLPCTKRNSPSCSSRRPRSADNDPDQAGSPNTPSDGKSPRQTPS